ncbi:hypothetical protein ACFOMD_03505 [Sphingoaurantiacus capsulatus]|uniref:Uncharacterized protein n=1 Tax=Sphingoaurantiacus capsulatus TaxID=1771310 RepID=A0ABV7X8P7_9SPHN
MTASATFLRRVLALDAITCAVTGVAFAAGASFASPLLGLPVDLLQTAGLSLLPFAAFVGWLASREQPPVAGVWIAIIINAIWVIDSFLIAAGMGAAPTTLGIVVVVAQALAVATFAELEYLGLKRMRTNALA